MAVSGIVQESQMLPIWGRGDSVSSHRLWFLSLGFPGPLGSGMSSELGSGMPEYEVGIRYQLSFRIWMKQSCCLSQASYLNHA